MALTLAKTQAGMVSGAQIPGTDIAVFKGIPFAAPPVGDLRWRPPQPVEPWEGVKETTEFQPAAWQGYHKKGSFYDREWGHEPFPRSEDCLYLNVWTPAKTTEDKLPVAIWIYGGGFMSGFAHENEFDGTAFAKKDVIYVSINYRLNVFGYIAHEDLEDENGHAGNYGVLDQIAAVKWVYDNIANFGGDPENIMVFGQSAGAGSTIALFCSPLTKNYIKRVVVHSGLGRFNEKAQIYDVGAQFKAHCGCESYDEMRKIPEDKLFELYSTFDYKLDRSTGARLPFGPYLDGWVITETYDDVVKNGSFNNVEFLMGSTKDDMAGGAPIPWMPPAINEGMRKLLLRNEELGRKPGYLYFFNRPLPGDDSGSWHSCDLWYIHGTMDRCWRPFEEVDYKLSETMVSYWTNYVKTGDPNGPGLPEWRPYTEDDKFTMILGEYIGQGEPEFDPNPDPNSARWVNPDDPKV